MPGLQPGWTSKDIQHFPRFLSAFQKTIHVIYPRSTQALQSCQDFNLDEPEKIYKICLDFYLHFKKLSMLYISQKHSGIRSCQDFNLDEPEKMYSICLDFYLHFKKLSMSYILEALRHTVMPGLQPGWTRKDTQHLPRFLSAFEKKLFMLYIPEALRHTVVPGLQPGWTRKDIQHLPRFLSAFQKTVHVIYPRSTQAYSHDRTSTWMNQKGYRTFA